MEQPRPTERSPEQLRVDQALTQAKVTGHPIDQTAARIIATWWHGGQDSALYSFQSTGAISRRLFDEIQVDYEDPENTDAQRDELAQLLYFISAQELDQSAERGAVEGWHERTSDWTPTDYDQDDECTFCGAHISDPHDPACPRADADLWGTSDGC